MIVVYTKKDVATNKLMVTRWMFVPKDKIQEYKNIPGVQQKFDNPDIPYGFYEQPTLFFAEEGKLRKYYTNK